MLCAPFGQKGTHINELDGIKKNYMNRKEKFLRKFDSAFRNEIIEFGKRITEISKTNDVIIFLARKSICLVDSLIELGLANIHCDITSSRILDYNKTWLFKKNVAIVDDALISGSTLHQIKESLKYVGCNKTSFHVLCVDKEWWSKELINPNKPYLELNSQQTEILCKEIVDAIATIPRPYSVDYPIFEKVRLRELDLTTIQQTNNWIFKDLSRTDLVDDGITNIVVEPTEEKIVEIQDDFGFDFNNSLFLKLRLYLSESSKSNKRKYHLCKILPIVVFPKLTYKKIDKLFDFLLSNYKNRNKIKSWFEQENVKLNIKNKLRFIQYSCSVILGRSFIRDINNYSTNSIKPILDSKSINYLFPPDLASIFIENSSYKINSRLLIHLSKPLQEDYYEGSSDSLNEIYSKLNQNFIDRFEKREIKVRREIKKYGHLIYKVKKNDINRLSDGISKEQLIDQINQNGSKLNSYRILSHYLDRAIDMGSVVPITVVDKNHAYRAYRHGEDVLFSRREMNLATHLLAKVLENSKRSELTHTIVEKLFVLFIRIGIELNFLTVNNYPLGDKNSVGIRYYLHGAVAGSSDKKIYRLQRGMTMAELMIENGFISKTGKANNYVVNKLPNNGMKKEDLSKVNRMGIVFGKLLSKDHNFEMGFDDKEFVLQEYMDIFSINNLTKKVEPKLNYNELILLSTCPYPKDVVGALAAEIDIFNKHYSFNRTSLFSKTLSNEEGISKTLRSSMAFTALNSAVFKYVSYKKNIPWKIKNKISDSLRTVDELYQENWDSFWPNTGENINSNIPLNLSQLLEHSGFWIFRTLIHYLLLELLYLRREGKYQDSKEFIKIEKELTYLSTQLRENFPKSLWDKLERIKEKTIFKIKEKNVDYDILIDYLITVINNQFNTGRQILSEVDCIAANYGKAEDVRYISDVLLIDVTLKYRENRDKFKNIFRQLVKKANNQRCFLFQIPKELRDIKTGICIVGYGEEVKKWMIQLVNNLANTIPISAFYFYDLDFNLRLTKPKQSKALGGSVFWEAAKNILKGYKKLNPNELVTITPYSKQNETIGNIINALSWNFIQDIGNYNKKYEVPVTKTYNIQKHKISMSKKAYDYDVGIITIVTSELKAVIDTLKSQNKYSSIKGKTYNKTFHSGLLDGLDSDLKVVATQTLEQGNRSIIAAYNSLVEEFNPKLIVVLGIAGSIHDDADICDVVIANSIIYYDKRKITKEGTIRNLDSFKINAWTIEKINNYLSHAGEYPKYKVENSFKKNFNVHVGPIGTGEAVLKDSNAEEKNWLKQVSGKTLAVEMEAGGAAQQFYEDELKFSKRQKGIMIIRGISDKADREKNDKWRYVCSLNAVKVLSEILKTTNLE